ncbi:hypothetical protein LCGC14_1689950, partial [marine sediment metagenome]
MEINKETGLLKGNITIGIFTDVKKGDRVEWIPTLFGERLTKWAEWQESWNANIISYYNFTGTTGDVLDDVSASGNDLDNVAATRGATGIIGNGVASVLAQGIINGTIAGFPTSDVNFTINSWIKTETLDFQVLLGWMQASDGNLAAQVTINLNHYFFREVNLFSTQFDTGITPTIGTFEMATFTYDKESNNMSFYLDGVLSASITSDFTGTSGTCFSLFKACNNAFPSNATLDEIGIWNRTLTPTEISDIFDAQKDGFVNGTHIEVFDFPPIVVLNSPINGFNSTNQTIIFNGTITRVSGSGILNVTLFIDGILNETNSSEINDTDYLFTKIISEGSHNWTYESCSIGGCTTATTQNFTIDSSPTINVFSPTNTTFATSTIFFNATSNLTVDKWIVNYNGTNVTLSDINTTLEVEDGIHQLLLYANNSITGVFGLNDTIFFSVDVNAPELNITEPFGVINFQDISENQTLRWNVSDPNIDTCLLQYEGVNTTLSCAANISNFTIGTARTLDIFANDTFGNMVSDTVTWSYLVLQTSTTFNSSSFETAEERFTVNVTTNGSVITAGSLTFDGTENTGATITNTTVNNYSITNSITIPASIGTKNHNFNLTIVGMIINTTTQPQIINATNFTICGAAPQDTPFINITFRNETLAEEDVNATISSTWTYSLTELSEVNKTLIFIDATQKLNYTFCSSPSDRDLNIDLSMTYNNDISQQRSFLLTTTLSNTTLT